MRTCPSSSRQEHRWVQPGVSECSGSRLRCILPSADPECQQNGSSFGPASETVTSESWSANACHEGVPLGHGTKRMRTARHAAE